MVTGRCLCGTVQWRAEGPFSPLTHCHCSRCRKAGASTIVFVKKGDLRWIAGREDVALYQPAPPYKYGRCFCRICGSSLGEILSEEESFPIAANALDGALEVRNSFHEFVGEKPGWYEICDGAKQSQGHPS